MVCEKVDETLVEVLSPPDSVCQASAVSFGAGAVSGEERPWERDEVLAPCSNETGEEMMPDAHEFTVWALGEAVPRNLVLPYVKWSRSAHDWTQM
jgi:hypothetical protein